MHQSPSPCTIAIHLNRQFLIFLIKDLFNSRNDPLVYGQFWFLIIWFIGIDQGHLVGNFFLIFFKDKHSLEFDKLREWQFSNWNGTGRFIMNAYNLNYRVPKLAQFVTKGGNQFYYSILMDSSHTGCFLLMCSFDPAFDVAI